MPRQVALTVPPGAPRQDGGRGVNEHALHLVVRVKHQRVAPQRYGPQYGAVAVRKHGPKQPTARGYAQYVDKARQVGVVAKVYEEVVVLDHPVLDDAIHEHQRGAAEVIEPEELRVLRGDKLGEHEADDSEGEGHLVYGLNRPWHLDVVPHAYPRVAGQLGADEVARTLGYGSSPFRDAGAPVPFEEGRERVDPPAPLPRALLAVRGWRHVPIILTSLS